MYHRYLVLYPRENWANRSYDNHRRKKNKDGKPKYNMVITRKELKEKAVNADRCPYTGKTLNYSGGNVSPNSASLDRISNEDILTNENTEIISNYADRAKGNMTREEFIEFYKKRNFYH